MILAIPISHRDILQAERLLNWIGFLATRGTGMSLRNVGVLLCVSQLARATKRFDHVVTSASRTFGKTTVIVPEIVEDGYPSAANQMFAAVLNHVGGTDDVLLLEPDAVPLTPDWYHRILEEWESVARANGKMFMGAYVGKGQTTNPHMSGNGVYGYGWRAVAPKLVDVRTPGWGWDNYAADQMLPHAHFTRLIQHVFQNPVIPDDLSILDHRAVIFHQNKDGRLIRLLNSFIFNNALNNGNDPVTQIDEPMMRFYTATNVNKRIRAAGHEFRFDVIGQHAGIWHGVYKTDNEQEQLSLQSAEPRGVHEITEEAYNAEIQKKTPNASGLQVLPAVKPKLTVAPVAGVVVENPKPASTNPLDIPPEQLPATIDDVITVGKVEVPSEVQPIVPTRKKRKA